MTTVDGVNWLYSQKSWVNQDVFIQWIQYEFPFVRRNEILLVFDSARSHISTKVKDFLKARGILFAVIPGGLTSLLQPCDVFWFKSLKAVIAEQIDTWKASSEHAMTRCGNPRPPTNEDMSHWLSTAWTSISPEMITKSFEKCFLGDSLSLHVAQHPLYGLPFRIRIATVLNEPLDSLDFEETPESDLEDIYEE